jgi:5'-nucleotidase
MPKKMHPGASGLKPSITNIPEKLFNTVSDNVLSDDFHITIFHNGNALSDYLQKRNSTGGGISRFATQLYNNRNDVLENRDSNQIISDNTVVRNVITLCAGNFLQSSILGDDILENTETPDSTYPYYDLFSLEPIGYDAYCLGPRDFDYGVEVLANFISRLTIPVLSNLDFENEPSLLALVGTKIHRSIILNKTTSDLSKVVKIGIVGVSDPELAATANAGNVLSALLDIKPEIRNLKNQGCRIIIILGCIENLSSIKNIINQESNIDIFINGGSDMLMLNNENNLVNLNDTISSSYPMYISDSSGKNIPLVESGKSYEYLGQLNCTFKLFSSSNNSDLVNVNGDSIPINLTITPLREFAFIEMFLNNFITQKRLVVWGQTLVPLNLGTEVIRSGSSNFADLVADSMVTIAKLMHGGLPYIVSVIDGGSFDYGEVIPSDTFLTLETIYEIIPNGKKNIKMIGPLLVTDLKNILENGVSKLASDGSYQDIAGNQRYLHISGMTVEFDPKYKSIIPIGSGMDVMVFAGGSRIINITLDYNNFKLIENGEVVNNIPIYCVTNNFLSNGGQTMPWGYYTNETIPDSNSPFGYKTIQTRTSVESKDLGISLHDSIYSYLNTDSYIGYSSLKGLNGVIVDSDYPPEGHERVKAIDYNGPLPEPDGPPGCTQS